MTRIRRLLNRTKLRCNVFDNYTTYLERLPRLVAILLLSAAVIMSQLQANPAERAQLLKPLRAQRTEALTSVNVDISKQQRQGTAENDQVDHRETAALLATAS